MRRRRRTQQPPDDHIAGQPEVTKSGVHDLDGIVLEQILNLKDGLVHLASPAIQARIGIAPGPDSLVLYGGQMDGLVAGKEVNDALGAPFEAIVEHVPVEESSRLALINHAQG